MEDPEATATVDELDAATSAEADAEDDDDETAAPPPFDPAVFESWLEQADPELLKRSRRIGGIAGQIAEQRVEREREVRAAEAAQQARLAEQQRIRELRRTDPYAYAELMDAKDEAEEAQARASGMKAETHREIMAKVGETLRSIDGWQALTPADINDLATRLVGVPDEDVLAHFTRHSIDLIGNKRAEKLMAERMGPERDAWEQERNVAEFAGSDTPDLRRGSRSTARFDPVNLPEKEFNEWYDKRFQR